LLVFGVALPQQMRRALVALRQPPVRPGPSLEQVGRRPRLDGPAEGLDGFLVLALAEVHLADQAAHVGHGGVLDHANVALRALEEALVDLAEQWYQLRAPGAAFRRLAGRPLVAPDTSA